MEKQKRFEDLRVPQFVNDHHKRLAYEAVGHAKERSIPTTIVAIFCPYFKTVTSLSPYSSEVDYHQLARVTPQTQWVKEQKRKVTKAIQLIQEMGASIQVLFSVSNIQPYLHWLNNHLSTRDMASRLGSNISPENMSSLFRALSSKEIHEQPEHIDRAIINHQSILQAEFDSLQIIARPFDHLTTLSRSISGLDYQMGRSHQAIDVLRAIGSLDNSAAARSNDLTAELYALDMMHPPSAPESSIWINTQVNPLQTELVNKIGIAQSNIAVLL